jgi:hypothetical protein
MSVQTLHPAISPIRRHEWQLMRDMVEGQDTVKLRGELYLPKPDGFRTMEDEGRRAYDAYRNRARVPDIVSPSVSAMIGIIHGREIEIKMPEALEFLWENADGEGLPLEAFHRRITRELLVIGGYGVLSDIPREGNGTPYLVGVRRDNLINWDSEFFVLDESRMIRKGFVWEQLEQYRLLTLQNGFFAPMIYNADGSAQEIPVQARGGGRLPRIPFAVGNAVDLSPKVEAPPLIGVANAAKSIYQLSADYRHQMFLSGQETLVAIDGKAPDVVGAGVIWEMESGAMHKAELKYVGPSCIGIDKHVDAMKDEIANAMMAGARLFQQQSTGQESGEARRLRFASETATLVSVAQNSCALIERAIRNIAMLVGANEDEVNVTAPADLMDRTMSPQEFASLFGVYAQGGMSWETYFAAGQRGGIFSPDDTAEDEAARLDAPLSSDSAV